MTSLERAELAALERMQENVETIDEFVARVTPQYAVVPWHLRQVYDLFELSRWQEVYATVSMPPRCGKTTSIALGLAWRILYDPSCLNFYATFGDNLSTATSRKIRKLARLAGVPLSKEVANVHEWETPWGGGLKATSVGGDVTGRGCNSGIAIADDLMKGRKKAESKQVRDDAWDWLIDDYMSRLEPGGSIIVNATRWHEDDPIGRLKANPLGLPWIHIELPAVRGLDDQATDEREDPDARALWPEGGYDLDRLAKIRTRSEHGWWSLYQQRPYPRGGRMFKRSWFHVIDEPPRGGVAVRGWDLAYSTSADSANTVGVKMRTIDGKLFVEDVVVIKGTPHEVEELIVNTADHDGPDVRQDIPQDPAAGKAYKAYLAAKLHGRNFSFSPEPKAKELRAEPVAAQAQAGNVYLIRAPWNDAFLAEHEAFPVGKLKDRVDATSRAYAALLRRPESAPLTGRSRALGGLPAAE